MHSIIGVKKRTMMRNLFKKSLLLPLAALVMSSSLSAEVIITAIVDGDLPGGNPKAIELYVVGTEDLANYTIEKSGNGGEFGNSNALEGVYTDQFVYITKDSGDSPSFADVFGTDGDLANLIIWSNANGNGDDAYRILDADLNVIDQVWTEDTSDIYKDSFMYRNDTTGPDAGWVEGNWNIPGNLFLDGMDAAQHAAAIPLGSYQYVASTLPSLTMDIADGATFYDVLPVDGAEIAFELENFNIGNGAEFDGYIQWSVTAPTAENNQSGDHYSTDAISISVTEYGDYTLSITLVDSDGNALDPAVSATATVTVAELETKTIAEVQNGGDTNFDSDYEFMISGVVTAVENGEKFFMQSGGGAWNGIYVENDQDTDDVLVFAIGDEVSFRAKADENNFGSSSMTKLEIQGNFEVVSSGNSVYVADILANQLGEAYESVMVNIINGFCLNPDAGFGEATLQDASGSYNTDDFIYAFVPNFAEVYSVVGVGIETFGGYKVAPRDADDISGEVAVIEPTLNILSPAPAEIVYTTDVTVSFEGLNFVVGEITDMDADGVALIAIDVDLETAELDDITVLTNTDDVVLEDLALGNHTVYMALATNLLEIVEGSEKSVTFEVAELVVTPIVDIQTPVDIGISDESPLKDMPVTTTGIVTYVELQDNDGTFENRAFYLQDGTGAWNGVYVYENDPSVEVGQELMITGTVEEFFGGTQISDVSSMEVLSFDNDLPAVVEITTNEVASEMYEGVLVSISDAEALSDEGFGVFSMNDGSGAGNIHRPIDLVYDITIGDIYNVAGPVSYSFNLFRVEMMEYCNNTVPTADFEYTVELVDGGAQVNFTSTTTGADDIEWDYQTGTEGGEANIEVLYTEDGTYSVSLTIENECGVEASATKDVMVQGIGVEENAITNVVLYPNPATETLNVTFASTTNETLEIRMVNTMGQVVYAAQAQTVSGTYTNQINVASFAKGVYTLEIVSADRVQVSKVSVQ